MRHAPAGSAHALPVVLFVLMAHGCGGAPAGPSSGSADAAPGTLVIDGQTVQGTFRGSGAFSRAPSLPWVDLAITSCSSAPSIGITLMDVATPPPPGVYAVSEVADRVSANATLSGQTWQAGRFMMAQYCGSGFGSVVFPPCTSTSPGSGSVTVAASSPSRISGSYQFRVVLPSNFQGLVVDRPPPTTKFIEGTFDLALGNRVLCS